MADNFLQQDNVSSTEKLWYKTVGGVVFAIIIGLIVLGAIVFIVLFSYYAWQIKYGGAEAGQKISEQFEQNFSVDENLASSVQNQPVVGNYNDYVREANPKFGNAEAQVKIISFVDFSCPYCQAGFVDFKIMMEKYEPAVQIIFKNLPLVDLYPDAMEPALASLCAHEQNQFWAYHDLLFTKKNFIEESLVGMATDLNFDIAGFSSCLAGQKYGGQILQDASDAIELGLRGTPTYFVNGYKVEGSLTLKQWDSIILEFLK